jgi:hypothetical protein
MQDKAKYRAKPFFSFEVHESNGQHSLPLYLFCQLANPQNTEEEDKRQNRISRPMTNTKYKRIPYHNHKKI